jgi:lactocepin
VAGTAPDAQLLVMKVFGKQGGAFDSDIMASIEDALLLGADSVNLSLGSTTAGASYDPAYQEMMERVMASGMTVIASAGNDGPWSAYTTPGYLYSEDVNLDTVGTPGSFASFMAVASVDNDGSIGSSIVVDGEVFGYTETLADPETGYGYGNNPLSSLDRSADGSGTEHEFVYITGLGNAADYAGIDLSGKIAVCSRGELYYYEKANIAAEAGAAALLIYNNEPGVIFADLNGINYPMPVVTVTQAAGAAIAAIGTEQQTQGGVSYRTGKLTVRAALSGKQNSVSQQCGHSDILSDDKKT